ncbi:MAG: nicotinate phosphoribosyltransferase [Clostridia bacterium]
MFTLDPLYLIDFYKAGHFAQYPTNTKEIFDNFTPRSSRTYHKQILWTGTKPIITWLNKLWKENFFEKDINDICNKYQKFMDICLGTKNFDVKHLRDLHALGYLPLEIKALPEGTLVPLQIPVFTILNTHPAGYWLPNYLESFLSAEMWKAPTTATTAYGFRKRFEDFAKITGANKDFIKWQGHDFAFRGMSGAIDSITSDMAHLALFTGTDTVSTAFAIEEVYGDSWEQNLICGSVPATEHSVMCSNIGLIEKQITNGDLPKVEGIESDKMLAEYYTFKRLINEVYPSGLVSIVSDSFDYFGVNTTILPLLKEDIMNRQGRVIIRPDSGDPVEVICGKNVIEDKNYLTSVDDIKDFFYEQFDNDIELGEDECGAENSYIAKIGNRFYNVNCVGEYVKECGGYSGNDYYTLDDVKVTYSEITDKTELCKIIGTFENLWNIFGGTINEKGYKVLDTHIGLIYGDSITEERQEEILKRLSEKGFTADNLVLGIGSYSYQYVTRDTYGFAMKATNSVTTVDGKDIVTAIYKDPKTDDNKFSKKSAKGYLKVIKDCDGNLKLVDQITKEEMYADDNELKTVFKDGECFFTDTFMDIRHRIDRLF